MKQNRGREWLTLKFFNPNKTTQKILLDKLYLTKKNKKGGDSFESTPHIKVKNLSSNPSKILYATGIEVVSDYNHEIT